MSSLQDLVSGDCGGSTALQKVSHRLRRQQEEQARLRLQRLPPEEALANEFLREQHHPQPVQGSSRFRMDHLLHQVHQMDSHGHLETGTRPKTKTAKAHPWLSDFMSSQIRTNPPPQHSWTGEFLSQRQPEPQQYSVRHKAPAGVNKWAEEYLVEEEQLYNPEDAELAQIAEQILDSTKDDPKLANSQFMAFMKDIKSRGSQAKCSSESPGSRIHCECSQHKKEGKSVSWAEEFATEFKAAATPEEAKAMENHDYWDHLESEWREMAAKSEEASWLNEFSTQSEPFSEYQFQEDNPLRETPKALEEAKAKLSQGDVPSAVLLLEAAVHQEPENAEAWSLLGTTQAKNEQDPAAIPALRQALKLNPADSTAQLALAVSYTNESYQAQACHVLQEWILQQPAYSQLARPPKAPDAPASSSFMSSQLHEETTDLFLSAAREQSRSVDPDVQGGLGVLFNLNGEYDKAVDCFRAALQVRPDDAQLWNRLGASLANGNRSEEAVSAYHQALNLSPGLVRARYNLGISCINLKAYEEAADHFLTALSFQAAGRGPQGETSKSIMSDGIWSSLRLCMSLLNRQDLYPDVDTRDVEKLSKIFRKD